MGIRTGLEVTIEITSYCPHYCNYCSTNAGPKGKHLSYERILKFLESLEDIDRINISGGEPLSHPKFYDILNLCYKITNDVRVYTNAIKHIIFNSDIIKEITIEANVCIAPGHIVWIPEKADKIHLLKLVHQGRAKNIPEKEIVVSHNFEMDCTHDCKKCLNILLQADGQVVSSPCKKKYR